MKKGCVKIEVEQTACQAVESDVLNEAEVESCNVCMSDKCNSSSTLKLSILTMAILLFVRFLMWL